MTEMTEGVIAIAEAWARKRRLMASSDVVLAMEAFGAGYTARAARDCDPRQSALMAAHDDLAALAERLEATHDKTHLGTAAGVRLAAFRLIELANNWPSKP